MTTAWSRKPATSRSPSSAAPPAALRAAPATPRCDGIRHAAGRADEKRRRHERQRSHRQEGLVVVAGEQAQRQPRGGQHERELADLRQPQAAPEGDVERPAAEHDRAGRDDGLQDDYRDRRANDDQRLLDEQRQVEQHADRGEEDAAEQHAERNDVGERLLAVLRLGDDQPRQKRSDGEREPGRGAHQGRADRKEADAEGEEIAVPLRHHPIERPAHREPPSDHQHDHRPEADQQLHPDRRRARPAAGPGEQGEQRHDRDDAEVLEEQDRHCLPPMAACRARPGPHTASSPPRWTTSQPGRRRRASAPAGGPGPVPAATASASMPAICAPPAIATDRPQRSTSESDSSRPISNSSSTTPISASAATASGSGIRAVPDGPMSRPTTRKPASGGRCRRCARATTGRGQPGDDRQVAQDAEVVHEDFRGMRSECSTASSTGPPLPSRRSASDQHPSPDRQRATLVLPSRIGLKRNGFERPPRCRPGSNAARPSMDARVSYGWRLPRRLVVAPFGGYGTGWGRQRLNVGATLGLARRRHESPGAGSAGSVRRAPPASAGRVIGPV